MAKKFRPQTPWIKREMAAHRTAMTTAHRPYSDKLYGRTQKAIEYAYWLAARDDIEIGCTGHIRVETTKIRWHGFTSPVEVATRVHFSRDVSIALPNWDFDPTAPAIDLDAAELPLAA